MRQHGCTYHIPINIATRRNNICIYMYTIDTSSELTVCYPLARKPWAPVASTNSASLAEAEFTSVES